MTRKNEKSGFHNRSFTTFALLLAALVIAITGLVLYVTPRGRVANWTGWTLMGLEKEQWGSIHINAALLFIGVAGFHVFFNWKVLLNYVRSRRQAGFRRGKEFAVALVVAVLFVGGTLAEMPPFSSIVALNTGIKDYWEKRSPAGPVAHAEELSLAAFASQVGVPLEEVMAALKQHGIEVDDPQAKLGEIAHAHGVTPSEIDRWIRPSVAAEEEHAPRPGGRGLGRMTLAEFCAAEKLRPAAFIAAMRKRGIEVEETATLRSLAATLETDPRQVGELIREMAR